jgi:hypothetical protein
MSRKLVAAAVVLGVLLWFILINSQQVTLYFPFGFGQARSSIGVVVLLSALAGALITGLLSAFFWAWRRYRPGSRPPEEPPAEPLAEDRPPSDLARTSDGIRSARWSAR